MPYDEFTADRVRHILNEKKVGFYEKKMFGGLCWMVDDKMCAGILFNKKLDSDVLMVRVGEEALESAKDRDGCLPMDFTGRPMKGYAFIAPEGFDRDSDLEFWVQKCLDFNPFAKASKKRKKS